MEQSFFRELLHYQRPKDNPFRLVFAGLVMFSILFLGYINHQLYFFILSAATIKTVNDSFICGR